MRKNINHNFKHQFQRKHSNGLRPPFLAAAALIFLTAASAWAGAFTSTFPAPNPPSGVALYGNAVVLGAGGLRLNPASQGSSGAAVISNLDPGFAVQGFSLLASVTTTNGGGSSFADGFGIYFSAPGVVPVGSYQNYEDLGVGSGLAMLVNEFSKTISIETGTAQFSLTLPNSSILVGTISANFSYDPNDGAVLTLTGSDNNQYVVSASAAQLAADGLNLQSGYVFTLGGRVGYPGTTNADSHTINSLAITTSTTFAGTAPVITSGPSNLTVWVSQTAQFAVSVSGSQPFKYQWFTNTVADLSGTSANYALANVTATDDEMTFQVIVTNNYGSATSGVATLMVLKTPVIITQPASQSINENCTATFYVVAGGQMPLYYQWFTNGVPIAGATNSAYLTAPVHPIPENNMQFKVVVSNSLSIATSLPATLTVITDTTPPSVTGVAGDPSLEDVTVTFSENVSAATALNTGNYQMNNEVSITSASFGANNSIVLLQTTPLGTNYYTLGISGIQDLSQTPNTMTATNVTFFAVPVDPLWNNIYFGVTEDAANPYPAGQSSQLGQAGNNWVDVEFDWSDYETSQGQYSSAYVQQVQAAINAAITNGSRVGLRMSWQYTPTWATQIPGAGFVDQYGDIYSGTPSSGMNVVAFTFNQNLRNIITTTMQNFFTALGTNYLSKISTISFGGNFVGEVHLPPPTFGAHSNCYWAYSSEAQTMFHAYLTSEYGTIASLNTAWGSSYASFSAVTFTPGQSSSNHQAATDFLNWLSYTQQQYLLFQRSLIRNYFSGYLMLEMGGWGMRTNYVTSNIAVDLNGSGTEPEEVSEVNDFPNFLKALSQAGDTKIIGDCTWIDPSLNYSSYGNPAPAGWIASFDTQYNFKTCGEYTASSSALDLGATRMLEYGLGLIFYVPESQFFSGLGPTVNNWSNMISRCKSDFGAGLPYMLSNDIGAVGTAGSDTISSNTITSKGAGTGYTAGSSSDNFHYLAADLEGDGQLVVNVASMSSGAAMQTGIMIRNSLNANDLYTAIFLCNNQCVMQSRKTAGVNAAVNYVVNGVSAPQWLKLQRTGNILQAYYSSDGIAWYHVGSQTNPMAYASYIGMAVSSGSSALNTSSFTSVNGKMFPFKITELTQNGTQVVLNWPSLPAHSYQIQYKNGLLDPNWSNLGSPITASAEMTASTNDSVGATTRFFRVVAQ